jgi:hypothetical protein
LSGAPSAGSKLRYVFSQSRLMRPSRECAPDALGDLLHERLQLPLARRRDAPKHRRCRAAEERAVEGEHVEMNV